MLRTAGPKVNATKCSFGLNYIPYLGYVITWEGIKPDLKKVQRIMDIGRPATTTEVWLLIGVFQYYMDAWPRRSYVLSTMIEASIGPER